MPTTHELSDDVVNYAWDNSHTPRLAIEPGDTVIFTTRDAADYYYSADSTGADVKAKGPLTGHP